MGSKHCIMTLGGWASPACETMGAKAEIVKHIFERQRLGSRKVVKMTQMKNALLSICIVLVMAACNLQANETAPVANGGEISTAIPEPSESTGSTSTGVEASATAEVDGASIEPVGPTPDPPRAPVPAQDRMQAADELIIQTIAMIDATTGWAIGGPGGLADSVLRTKDGGLSWDEVSPPEPAGSEGPLMAAGGFIDASLAWIVYHPEADARPGTQRSLKVWFTNDAGQHWRLSSPVSLEFVGAQHSPAWVHFASPEQGWILARYGGSGMHRYPVYLLHSLDAGAYWEILEDPYEGLWLQSCPKTGWAWHPSGIGLLTLGLCPFESAEIELTTDAGATWSSIRLPFPPGEEERFGFSSCEAQSPLILSEQELLLGSECPLWEDEPETVHLLYHSQDLGESWQIQEYPGGSLYLAERGVILALGRELHRSDNGGTTWTLIKQLAWDGQFSFVNALNGWAVARNDGEIALVHTLDGGKTWSLIEPELIP
jgi:photosystem II stability/assembly factor-like uncharacterized protein